MAPTSDSIDLAAWEERFARFLDDQTTGDAAHDRAHVERVVTTARQLAHREGAQMSLVVPAAWLHDCVSLAKDDPERDQASRRAADTAVRYLDRAGYPSDTHAAIRHAIEAHSYSAGIEAETAEARVVQDADRLDALGAVGIARCFLVGGQIGASLCRSVARLGPPPFPAAGEKRYPSAARAFCRSSAPS